MRNVTIVVLFFSCALVLLGSLTSIQYAEGAVSWNGFLQKVGFNAPSVYEVSDVSIIPKDVNSGGSGEPGTPVELLCSDGDWLLVEMRGTLVGVALSTGDLPLDENNINVRPRGSFIEESESGVPFDFVKLIGFEGFAESNRGDLPFDIPVTLTILCHSPSSMMTVGGEWQATDTTALIIGYSVLNAYWLAPIGIGVGIYLVKRKL